MISQSIVVPFFFFLIFFFSYYLCAAFIQLLKGYWQKKIKINKWIIYLSIPISVFFCLHVSTLPAKHNLSLPSRREEIKELLLYKFNCSCTARNAGNDIYASAALISLVLEYQYHLLFPTKDILWFHHNWFWCIQMIKSACSK